MKLLLMLSIVCLVILCACDNPLNVNKTTLPPVTKHASFYWHQIPHEFDLQAAYNYGIVRSNKVYLSWFECWEKNFLSYRIYRNGTMIKTFVSPDSNSFVDSLLTPDTQYQYTLVSVLKNGMAYADTVDIKTPEFLKPERLSYTYVSGSTVRITWDNHAESAHQFIVQRYFPGQDTLTAQTETNSYLDTNAPLHSTFRYRVKAYNSYEETEYTNWVTMNFNNVMNAPHLTSVLQMQPGTDVKLEWTDNSTAEIGFRILRSEYQNQGGSVIGTTEANVLEFTDTSAKEIGKTYYYNVEAYNDTASPESNRMSVTISEIQNQSFDFEADDGSFLSSSSSGWQWGHTNSMIAHSGSKLWATSLNGTYGYGVNYRLTSPLLTVPGNARLSFYHAYDMETGYDGGNVKISTNNGASWTILQPEGGYPSSEISSSDEPGFTGHQANWAAVYFDLSAYAGQMVLIRWTFTSDNSVTGMGWFIDDMTIGNSVKNTSAVKEVPCLK